MHTRTRQPWVVRLLLLQWFCLATLTLSRHATPCLVAKCRLEKSVLLARIRCTGHHVSYLRVLVQPCAAKPPYKLPDDDGGSVEVNLDAFYHLFHRLPGLNPGSVHDNNLAETSGRSIGLVIQ